jgi:4-amino-4-deoxy-L-arabinose transferase-like glycosyltransferase
MPQWARHYLLIIAVAAPVLFFRLGDARLWDRDEPRNAQCAVEMVQRGDWVVPWFNNELRTHKPVLLYWLIMSSYAALGVNEFAARFPSALLGLGTILCTYQIGARLFHRRAGLWAALALTPALMFDVASRAATPDAALIFCVTATLCAYVQFAFPSPEEPECEPRFPSSQQAAVVYGLMALAVLAKGPVGIVLPLSIMGGSLWITRCVSWNPQSTLRLQLDKPIQQIIDLAREFKPLTAIAMLLLIAAPWYALVGWRTGGEFLVGFLWDHNVRRATESLEGHSGPAILFYPATIWIGFFPASIFLLPSILETRRQFSKEPARRAAITLCAMWALLTVALFSLAKTKLPSYVTPCYPALALLVGNLLYRSTSGLLLISSHWFRWSATSLAVIGVAGFIAIWMGIGRYFPGEEWVAGVAVVLIVGGVGALVVDFWLRFRAASAGVIIASGLVFSLLLFGLGPAAADRHQQSHLLLAALCRLQPAQIGSWHCLQPSWVFYLGRPIEELKETSDAAEFLSSNENLLIVCSEDYPALSASLPKDVQILSRTPRFLKEGELLVVGRNQGVGRTSRSVRTDLEVRPTLR